MLKIINTILIIGIFGLLVAFDMRMTSHLTLFEFIWEVIKAIV